MTFCPKCGKEVSSEARYCPSCGANLRVDKDLLREKIAEARHNQIIGEIMTLTGFITILPALYIGFITETTTEWRDLTLYEITYHPHATPALILLFLALCLIIIGSATGIYYSLKRSKLMKQLESLK